MISSDPIENSLSNSSAQPKELPPLPPKNDDSLALNQEKTSETPVMSKTESDSVNDTPTSQERNDTPTNESTETNTAIYETGNDQEDDEEDTAIMDPDHPLMARVQEALRVQLSEKLAYLEAEYREKEEIAKKTSENREEAGVELYTAQQLLAKLQASIEGCQDNIGLIKRYRDEAERNLRLSNEMYIEKQTELKERTNNLESNKMELDKITRAIKQVDLYNEDLRSNILIAKRTTLKAEEDIVKQEMEKKRQDFYIDRLNDSLRKLQEQRGLYETQWLAQQKQTKASIETLQDALTEMDAVQFEKRQLLHQWKSSIVGLERRDEVLTQVQNGIQKNKDTLLSMNGELEGFKASFRKTQEEGESFSSILGKIEGEIELMKYQVVTIQEQRDTLKESYVMFMKSLNQTELDLSQVANEKNTLQQETLSIIKSTQQVKKNIQLLEEEIADRLQFQLTLEKGSAGSKKDGAKLRAMIHEKESTIYNIDNQAGVMKLEALNISGRIASLKASMTKIEEESKKRNKLIENYERDFKIKGDELEKKQSEMEFLNKKLDALTSGNKDESMGPLEVTIHSLAKSIVAKEKECMDLSQFWLKAQNELVNMTRKSFVVAEEIQDFSMKLSVLDRKKMTINTAFENEAKEIKEHNREIKKLQTEMVKINQLLSRQSNMQNQLEEHNLELEQEFRARLKQAEMDSYQLEEKVQTLQGEREKGLSGILEAERQIMLWEKKIQLARETQAALDPNVGATEITEMTAEIHRMKLRHANLLKIQEKMISEMERSIHRRTSISNRTKVAGKVYSQVALQKAITDLTKKIKQTMADLQECDQDIATLNSSKESMNTQLVEARENCEKLEKQENQLLQDLEITLLQKQMQVNLTVSHQKQIRRYQDLKEMRYVFTKKSEEDNEKKYVKLVKLSDTLDIMTKKLKRGPGIGHFLSVVSDYLKEGLAGCT